MLGQHGASGSRDQLMSRELVAYLLLGLLIASTGMMTLQSYRFVRFERMLRFGIRNIKPVRKPFWIP